LPRHFPCNAHVGLQSNQTNHSHAQDKAEAPKPTSTAPAGPTTSGRYSGVLKNLQDAKEKEQESKKRLEDKKQDMLNKASEPVLTVPPMAYPPMGDQFFPQVVEPQTQAAVAAEIAAHQAEAEARLAAEVDAEMAAAPGGMPMSSTRKLLEKQYRREMKMKMAHDMQVGEAYGRMHPVHPPVPPPMDPVVAEEAAHHRAMMQMMSDSHLQPTMQMGSPPPFVPPPGSPGALAAARNASMALQSALSKESKEAGSP